ncbi:MAG: hypothetical protein ACQEQ0_10150 [Bacteroidota bacterium]
MIRITIVFALLLFLFAQACKNSPKDKNSKEEEQAEEQAVGQPESDKKPTAAKSTPKTMEARFKKFVVHEGETTYVFVDEEGKEWELRGNAETQDTDFTGTLEANTIYPGFDSQWFLVAWYGRKAELNKGGEDATSDEEGPFLLSVKKIDREEPESAKTPAITFEELQNAVFFGTEPFWSMKFRDNGMYKEGPGQEEELFKYVVHSGGETPVKAISENEVQVDVYPENKENDSYRWHITIRKETCSDGMSENTYPYSIEISWEDTEEMDSGKIGEGCGRIDKKRVDIEEIKKTKKIKKYTVSEVMHEPGREFAIGLEDTFDFSGHFTFDPMSEMLKFHVDEEEKPGIELEIDGFTRPLFTNFNFTNEKDVKAALGEEKVNQIRNREKIQARIVFKNYHVEAKLDGYGGASAEFVKMGD